MRINGSFNREGHGTTIQSTTKKTILAVLAMGALSCALFSQQAQAAQITGEIHFAGDAVFDSTSLATATAVNHWISAQNTLE
jgi:hypothetical protein